MLISSAFDLYLFLEKQNLLQNAPPLWWPNAGSFEVVVGAILTQNTTWHNVEQSLSNLENYITLEKFCLLDENKLKEKIKPSGFYNQKAPRLKMLTCKIQKEFGSFQNFQKNVTREWLLAQKGIGNETADAILCYGCLRAEMVVDTYTKRLLKMYGIEFQTYDAYKYFLQEGVQSHFPISQHHSIYAQFHGMIVEYNKKLKTFK